MILVKLKTNKISAQFLGDHRRGATTHKWIEYRIALCGSVADYFCNQFLWFLGRVNHIPIC